MHNGALTMTHIEVGSIFGILGESCVRAAVLMVCNKCNGAHGKVIFILQDVQQWGQIPLVASLSKDIYHTSCIVPPHAQAHAPLHD